MRSEELKLVRENYALRIKNYAFAIELLTK